MLRADSEAGVATRLAGVHSRDRELQQVESFAV